MRAHLRAGVAIYNEGGYHAAHDAWEGYWLELPEGDDDELFLHGLIQFTAAVYHARERNWSGATGLAESAREYLGPLPADYRDVNVGAVRDYLAGLAPDPERIERASPPRLTHEGAALALADLEFDALAVAAAVIAEEEGYEEDVIERAVEYARADLEDGEEGSRFLALVTDFATSERERGVVFQRLAAHVDRRRHREGDVEGLFDGE